VSGPAPSTAGALAAAVADQAVATLLRQVAGLGSGPRPGASA
jgi:hypothetical protein